MAKLPVEIPELVKQFGPTLNRVPAGGWVGSEEEDRMVKTHCCFCGQQCGIQLRVRNNKVVGWEPWEDFPFNLGKLCPKGVKRYMQDEHPDRLKQPLQRVAGQGFRTDRVGRGASRVVSEIQRIQKTYGNDAFALLTGASLTNEKAYLIGKFARVAVRTANIDYNGRLCMVSAGAASKKVFGIDRSANPWSDISKAKVILAAGANVAECAPITTDYLWQARENGGKLIILDPRLTPIARNADLYIPVRSGGDIGVFNGMLHIMIERGWIDRDFIAQHTTGFEQVAEAVKKYTPEYSAKIAGVPAEMIVRAAEMWGPAPTSFLLHARGIEHHSKGVDNCIAAINLVVASGRIGREGCGYAMITGQGNGQGAREQGQKCDQLPGSRDIANPEHRKYIAGVWGVPEESIPGKGLSAVPLVEAIHEGKIKGLLSICFNPTVSLPDANFVRAALEKLEFYVNIDFFLSETAQLCRHRARRLADGRRRGHDDQRRRPRHPSSQGGESSRRGARGLEDHLRPCRSAWATVTSSTTTLLMTSLTSCAWLPRAASRTTTASRGNALTRTTEFSGPARRSDIPEHRACTKAASLDTPDGKAHFIPIEWRPSAEMPDDEYPIILTTGRVVSHFLSGTQTRRIGGLLDQYPQPLCEMHPRLAEKLGIARWRLRQSGKPPRTRRRARAGRQDHPARHGVRSLSLAA